MAVMMTACNTKIKVDYGYDPNDYVKLGQYKGIEADVDAEGIENDLIEKRIKSDVKENTTYTEVAREAREGDKVIVDFTGSIGGSVVDGFSNSDYELILGEDTFVVDGFIDALYGMKAGDLKVVTLKVPNNFTQVAEYAGSKIVYEITVQAVNQPNVPMITDAYVQENLSFNTVEEYRASVKAELQETIDEQIKEEKMSKVLTQLQDNCEILGYPEEYLQQKTSEYDTSIKYYAMMLNQSNDEYCQEHFGLTFDEYVKKAVAQSMIMQVIIEKENMYITEYQYKEELEQFAKDRGFSSKDTFTERYDKDTIVKGMLIEKAQDFVLDNAVYK